MGKDFDLIDLDNSSRGIKYPELYDDRYSDILKKSIVNSFSEISWFVILLVYLETVFHIWAFDGLSTYFFLKLFLCIPSAIILSLFTSYFSPKTNRVVNWVVTSIVIIIYVVNILYRAIFQVFFSLELLEPTNMKVIQYYREIIQGIIDNWFVLLLTVFVPIILLVFLNSFRILRYRHVDGKCFFIHPSYLAVTILLTCLFVLLYGKDSYSAYDLMKYENVAEYSIEKLGLLATDEISIRNMIFPRDLADDSELTVWVYDPEAHKPATSVSTSTQTPTENPTGEGSENTEPGQTDAEIITEIIDEIDTSPNMLNIDFVSLAENESDKDVAALHKYFASIEPTYKNEYTGMFKGFNLIFMTAEGFCDLAVDETHTPTLYKLVNEGFVFTNFYNPRTSGSTSDGEFICSSSLVAACGSARNFRICGQNSMPFTIGNMFNRTYGITSRAFHDNDYAYYARDISYPAYGFYYKGKGNGLEVPKHWPESDLDMMKLSIPDYIDDELFCIYYMTVSGHLNYNFTGNYCAKIHKDEVQDLPYSDPCKAYVACNMEFDLALEYLLNALEEKGIADHTVICFTGDHWPYGLTNEEISEMRGHKVEENFELYKSNLILWSGAIKEPIVIDKACCSMDILPTLLNLFGMEYDSRLLMGHDILSDSPAYVSFMNGSIITDKMMYNASNGKTTYLVDSSEIPENYLKTMKTYYKNQKAYSKSIMITDYYKYICDCLGITMENPEQNYIPDYSKYTKPTK